MTLTISMFFIVCPLVFLAGLVDSIAGGGGLISLPAYLLAGLPVHNAIATNKFSSAIGTCVSTMRYIKNKFADLKLGVPCIAAALAGSAIGAQLTLRMSDEILKKILLVVLPVVAFFVLHKSPEEKEMIKKEIGLHKKYAIAITGSLLIGIYDGFYGPGTGTFLILIYTKLCGIDIKTASGNAKMVNLASNVAAFVTFLLSGKMVVALGLTAAVFCMAGHYVGSGLVIKKGSQIVKPIIIVVLVLLFLKILFKI